MTALADEGDILSSLLLAGVLTLIPGAVALVLLQRPIQRNARTRATAGDGFAESCVAPPVLPLLHVSGNDGSAVRQLLAIAEQRQAVGRTG